MKNFQVFPLCICSFLLAFTTVLSQNQDDIYLRMAKDQLNKEKILKTYVIEREIPEAGKLTPEQLKGISQKSCAVIEEMGPEIEWLHSYVTENKVYCVYRASNLQVIKEHADKGGFPANQISELAAIINPGTADE